MRPRNMLKLNHNQLEKNRMINVRNLCKTDDLGKAAELIFQVDPYICPDFFGDAEHAKRYGKILFTEDGGLFDFSRVLVAEDSKAPGALLGILVYADNTITSWNCDEMKKKVESLGIAIPANFDRANKDYMELVVEEAKKLENGVAEVELCSTDAAHRGRGIAKAFFDKFLSIPHYHEQHLTVLADNLPAIRLYKKKGFSIVSFQSGYPDDSVKTFNMVRKSPIKIPIEISARHVHLSQHIVNVLFGENYSLTPDRNLSQPGEFCSKERINIVGPREVIHRIAVLGPVREHTQVELSMTDARRIGLNPPIRESGDHPGSASCRLVGPKGEFDLEDGVIIAKRHLHLNPEAAKGHNVNDGDLISVEIVNSRRPLIFKDVVVRVNEKFSPVLHLDTDEGNAAGVTTDSFGIIVK